MVAIWWWLLFVVDIFDCVVWDKEAGSENIPLLPFCVQGGSSSCNGFIEPNGGNRTKYQEGVGFKSGRQHCFQISQSVQSCFGWNKEAWSEENPFASLLWSGKTIWLLYRIKWGNKPHVGKVFVLRVDANTSSRCTIRHRERAAALLQAASFEAFWISRIRRCEVAFILATFPCKGWRSSVLTSNQGSKSRYPATYLALELRIHIDCFRIDNVETLWLEILTIN